MQPERAFKESEEAHVYSPGDSDGISSSSLTGTEKNGPQGYENFEDPAQGMRAPSRLRGSKPDTRLSSVSSAILFFLGIILVWALLRWMGVRFH